METNNETINESEVNEETVAEEKAPQNESEPIMYTEEEMASRISSAVQKALDKQRKNQAKSNEDLAQELAELKAELARKENESYVSTEVTKRNIPSTLMDLFYSEDTDVSKAKLDLFSKWYKNAIDDAVDERLSSTKTPQLGNSTPGASSAKKAVTSFSQWLEANPTK